MISLMTVGPSCLAGNHSMCPHQGAKSLGMKFRIVRLIKFVPLEI